MDRGVSIIEARIRPAADGWRLDRALADAAPTLSRERLKVLINAGQVSRDGLTVRDPAKRTGAGEVFAVTVPLPTLPHNEAQAIDFGVAFEDDHLIVVDKPAGLVVHPAAGNLDGTLVNALLHHCGGSLSGIGGVARPGIVHRIDKDTSGLMVAAKTDRAHEGLARQFADHSIDRRYLAITRGKPNPAAGKVDAPLARSPADRKKVAIVAGGKRAVTHYRTLQPLTGGALVECRLETGRTHQVRVHMASLGHPLIGDPVYGGAHPVATRIAFRRQALHAARLGFKHPITGETQVFTSEMPADMQELFRALDA